VGYHGPKDGIDVILAWPPVTASGDSGSAVQAQPMTLPTQIQTWMWRYYEFVVWAIRMWQAVVPRSLQLLAV